MRRAFCEPDISTTIDCSAFSGSQYAHAGLLIPNVHEKWPMTPRSTDYILAMIGSEVKAF